MSFDWGDGIFGDASGPSPTLTSTDLAALGIDDGPSNFTATVQVDDDDGGSSNASTDLTVENVNPIAIYRLNPIPESPVRGQLTEFTFGATDVAADQASFDFVVDWNDGSPIEQASGPDGSLAYHTFDAEGTYTVQLTATDKDGDTSYLRRHQSSAVAPSAPEADALSS